MKFANRPPLLTVALLALGSFLLLGVALFFTAKDEQHPQSTGLSARKKTASSQAAQPAPMGPSTPASIPSTASSPNAGPNPPQCQRHSECLGPHSPDCVRAHCVDHRCVYDHRGCACQNNEQCDDGDPCTRDLCFSRTNACVHVDDGCPEDVAR